LTENRKETKPTNQPTKPCQISLPTRVDWPLGSLRKLPSEVCTFKRREDVEKLM